MATWYSDSGFYSDAEEAAVISGEFDLQITTQGISRPFYDRQLEGEFDLSMKFTSAIGIDLLRLMPEKFRSYQILIDYLAEAGIQIGSWLTQVQDIVKLLNTRTVNNVDYLKHLGALIGVEFPPEDTSTVDEIRKNISLAIDWYKVKGTYKSIQIISLIQSFTVNVYDMYTNDYVNFVMTDWAVCEEGKNPPGFSSDYYKSPHFGVEILLDKIYTVTSGSVSGGSTVLWESKYLNNLYNKVEETRPVHTVPHYILLLNPKTDEFRNVITVNGGIEAKVTGNWQWSTRYLDESESGRIWYTDSGIYLDSNETAFINSITKWVLGTGIGNISDPNWKVKSPVLTGTINAADIIIHNDKITFEFIVPKSVVQAGIKELGLYVGGTNTLVAGATFPPIEKDNRTEFRVLFEIYRESLA